MGWFSNLWTKLFGGGSSKPTPVPIPVPTPTPAPVIIVKKNAGAKYAVIDGINQYRLPGNNLHGCVNDALDVKALISNNFGFDKIVFLQDKDATAPNIVEALKEMIGRGKEGDELFFYHSSHGTRYALPGMTTEDDVLVTYDFDWDSPNNLSGQRLGQILQGLQPNTDCTIMVDACHSGSVTKGFNKAYKARKFWQPPTHIVARSHRKNFEIKKVFHKDLIQNQGYLLLAGCADDQTSEELQLGSQVRGIFTYSMTDSIRKSMGQNWQYVFGQATATMARGGYEQTPQLSGDKYKIKLPFTA